MIEVEIKVRLENRGLTEQRLQEIGFEKEKLLRECDIYFNHPAFDLKKQDMAFRVRSCEDVQSGEKQSFLTYKGPKLDAVSMTRKELETMVEDSEICIEMFQALGFVSLPEVRKKRQYYVSDRITACIDQVDGLGAFLELELLTEEESDREQALEKLNQMLEKIGLKKENTIRTSYLSMLCDLGEKRR